MQNQPPRAHLVAANASNEHRRLQYKQMRVEKAKEMAKTTKQLEMEAQILEEQAGLVRRLAEVEQKKAEMRSLSVQKPKVSFSIRDSAGRKLSKPRLDAPTEDSNSAPWLVKKGCRGYEEAIRKKLQAQRQQEEERIRVVAPVAQQDPNKVKELDSFLNQIGMQQCFEPVKRAGVTSVDQLKQYDLKKLNLLPGYEIKLAKRLAEFKAGLEMQGKLIPMKSTTITANTNQQAFLPPKPKPPSATSAVAQPLAGLQVVSAQPKGSRATSNQPVNSGVNGAKWQQARLNGFTGPALVKTKHAPPNSAKHASNPIDTSGDALFTGARELSDGEHGRHADEGCSECSQHYKMQTTGGFRSNKHMTIVGNDRSKHSSSHTPEEKVDLPLERSAATGLASNRSNKFSSIVEKHRSIHSDSTVSEVRKEKRSGDRQGERSWRESSFKTDSQEASLSQEQPPKSAKRSAPQTSSSGTDAPKAQVPVCCWRCLAVKDSKEQMIKSPLFAEPQRLFCSQQCLDLETKEKFARCTCGRPAEKGIATCHNGNWYCQPECMPQEEGDNMHEDDQEFGELDFEAFQEDPPEIADNAEYYQQLDDQVDLDFEGLI